MTPNPKTTDESPVESFMIKCPERLKDFPESYHPYSCRCKGTGQINPELSAEEICIGLETTAQNYLKAFENKQHDVAGTYKAKLNEQKKQKFIPLSAVQEMIIRLKDK
ncbi:MAG: hypothetical protein AABY22_22830 [Nanoarchaeota archaeon]